jgi:MtN3 and saliva related transmembrane protein
MIPLLAVTLQGHKGPSSPRPRSTQGMNPRMAGITGSFQILWIWYGLLIDSKPAVLWNTIGVLTNSFSVGAYLYFARAERLNATSSDAPAPNT